MFTGIRTPQLSCTPVVPPSRCLPAGAGTERLLQPGIELDGLPDPPMSWHTVLLPHVCRDPPEVAEGLPTTNIGRTPPDPPELEEQHLPTLNNYYNCCWARASNRRALATQECQSRKQELHRMGPRPTRSQESAGRRRATSDHYKSDNQRADAGD